MMRWNRLACRVALGMLTCQAAIMASGGQALDRDLVLYAPMNVGHVIGKNVIDAAGDNDGRITGSDVEHTDGMIGKCLRFTKRFESDYVTFSKVPKLKQSDYTVSLWYRPDDVTDLQFLFGTTGEPRERRGWNILAGHSLTMTASYAAGFDDLIQQRTERSESSRWQHVAFVVNWEQRTWTAYYDGSSAPFDPENHTVPGTHVDTFPATADFSSSGSLRLGNHTSVWRGFLGKVDELAVWTRPLEAAEIRSIFAAGRAGIPLDQISSAHGPPAIDSQPKGGEFAVGETLRMEVSLAGEEEGTSFQWWKDGRVLAGETAPIFERQDIGIDASGTYSVAVVTPSGATVSSEAEVSVFGLTTRRGQRLRGIDNESDAIAMEGDLAAVGLPWPADTVQLFRRDAATGSWNLEKELGTPAEPDLFSFGAAVAIADGRVFVSAPVERSAIDRQAFVSVFEQDDAGTWKESAHLELPGASALPLAASGGRVVAGDTDGGSFGEAYVFEVNPEGAWAIKSTLIPRNGHEGIWFPSALAIDGDTIVAGARRARSDQQEAVGSAFVYQRSGFWSYTTRLGPEVVEPFIEFGASVAVSGNTIAVGAPGFDRLDTTVQRGAVIVFEKPEGGSWEKIAHLSPSTLRGRPRMGQVTAMNENWIVSGTSFQSFFGFEVFERSQITTQWRAVSKVEFEDISAERDQLAIFQNTVLGLNSRNPNSLQTFTLPPRHNVPPRFETDPTESVQADAGYAYRIRATDTDGDPLAFEAVELPEWLTFTDEGNGTALLNGATSLKLSNDYPVTLVVRDVPAGARVTQSFTVSVSAVGAALTIIEQPRDQYVALGRPLRLSVNVSGGESPYSFKWHLNGAPLAGEESAELVIDQMSAGLAGNYDVTITDGITERRSAVAIVKFVDVPGALVVPTDYPTVQAALDAAEPGTSVLVAPGTHEGWLEFNGKQQVLESLEGPQSTVLLADRTDRRPAQHLITMDAGGRVEGFTFLSPEPGFSGGVHVSGTGTSAIVRNCIFEASESAENADGSGVLVSDGAAAEIDRNIFRNHPGKRRQSRSIIHAIGSDITLRLTNNLFSGNWNSTCVGVGTLNKFDIINNTFAFCQTAIGSNAQETESTIRNNIFAATSINLPDGEETRILFDRNLIHALSFGATGSDPVVADPYFVNPKGDDFRLRTGSPATDAGLSAGAPAVDFTGNTRLAGDNTAVDLGAFEGTVDITPPVAVEQTYTVFDADETDVTIRLDELFAPGKGSAGEFQYHAEPEGIRSIFSGAEVTAGNELHLQRIPDSYGTGVVTIAATDENGLRTETRLMLFFRPQKTVVVPDEFTRIQGAVDSLTEPAVVLVRPGSYFEHVNVSNASVFLRSTDGPERTAIIGSGLNGDQFGTVIKTSLPGQISGGEISGFTIRNGVGQVAAIGFPNHSLIHNNIIEHFTDDLFGGNDGTIIDGNVIRHNQGRNQLVSISGRALLTGNLFYGNSGVTIDISPPAVFVNNTLYGNEIALKIGTNHLQTLTIRNNIIAGNTIGTTSFFFTEGGDLVWEHNLVSGNDMNYDVLADQTGQKGNIGAPPGFVSAEFGDFRIQPDSAAFDAGSGNGMTLFDHAGAPRLQGAAINIGAFEATPPPDFFVRDIRADHGQIVLYVDAPGPYQVETSGDLQHWNAQPPIDDFSEIWIEKQTAVTPRYYRVRER